MAEDFRNKPLSELLQDRSIFHIFDEEFQKAGWLDVTALLNSESRIEDLYEDKTVPADVLDRIVERVSAL
ncbi:MAG: hypothetical protein PUG16_04835 [Lachnospiraceae bacterium]|jgi:hypothetical protein|nr:hypothetical protein [Lachnospiraceae bacterium]